MINRRRREAVTGIMEAVGARLNIGDLMKLMKPTLITQFHQKSIYSEILSI